MDAAIEKDLFLCHSSVDKDWVERLGSDIELEEWNGRPLTVFLDKWDIDIGDNIVAKINHALSRARFVAIVMSPEMMVSEWCTAEFSSVLMRDPVNRQGKLVPIRRRDISEDKTQRLEVPPLLQPLNYLDFRKEGSYKKSLARLIAHLRGESPPRGRRSKGQAQSVDSMLAMALPASRVEPDRVQETLLGNLLPVPEIPGTVWSAPTRLRTKSDLPPGPSLPPFILRDGRLFTFSNLGGRNSPFSELVYASGVREHAVADWRADPDRWRWVIALLNISLTQYVRALGVNFDPEHRRYFFRRQGPGGVTVTWGVGDKRTVVRAPDPKKEGAWVHQGARIRFETVGPRLFLSIDPIWVFTKDGYEAIDKQRAGPLAMQWTGRERNGSVLRHVLMWSDFLTQGRKVGVIPAGDQQIILSRLPAPVRSDVGLADDHTAVRSLLRFTKEELALTVPPAVRTFVLNIDEPNPLDDLEDDDGQAE